MKTEDLKRFSLLVELTEEDRDELFELVDDLSLKAGQTLFREGDEADAMFLLAEGSLRVSSERSGDLGLMGEGSALGATSLIVVGVRQATAVAESDCELVRLSRGSFRRLAEDAPRTACRLAEAAVRELANGVRSQLHAIEDVLSPRGDAPAR